MSAGSFVFCTLFVVVTLKTIFLLGTQHWLYWLIIPPLVYGVLMVLAARVPRSYEKSQGNLSSVNGRDLKV